MRRQLIIMTRYPEAGRTKTRLIPALGAAGAAALQREMTEHIVERAWPFATAHGIDLVLRFAGGDRERVRQWLGADLAVEPQGAGDLGQRMTHAIAAAFTGGAQAVVMIGADCPGVDAAVLDDAFTALDSVDLVLGPAGDGGYYLIGMGRPEPRLFDGIEWGSSCVLAQTRAVAERVGLVRRELPVRSDVDRPEDLPVWQRESRGRPRISVIIPTLDEALYLRPTLRGAAHCAGVELVVADGGSTDGSPAIARELGARIVSTEPGRALQMNAGARVAAGDILLFLHADTLLPGGYGRFVRTALADRDAVAGAFCLAIGGPSRGLRAVARLANLRARWLGLPYGDQAVFLRATTFSQLDGFPELPIMEDFVMARRLRKHGRIVTVPATVTTAARRWNRLGVLRTTLINQLIVAAFLMGMSPERIARFYGRRPPRKRGP